MGEEERLKLFEDNKSVVYSIVNKKYRNDYLNNFYDDLVQEGLICLWNLIPKERFFKDGNVNMSYVYGVIWGKIGSYVRRKIYLDERVKMYKGVEFFSLNVECGKDDDNQIIDLMGSDLDFEAEFFKKVEIENLKKFAKDIDENIKFTREKKLKYSEVINESLLDLSQLEIAEKLNVSQVTVSRRLREIISIYRDTFLREEAC